MEVQAIELFCSDNEQNSNSTILRLQRRVIGTIISEIRSAGYVLPQLLDGTPILLCIPACGVGAPHRRDRVWFVAHSRHIADRLYQTRPSEVGGRPQEKKTVVDKRFHIAPIPEYLSREQVQYQAGSIGPYYTRDRHAADTDSAGQQRSDTSANGDSTGSFKIPDWNQWPSQPPILGRNDGIPKHLDGITLSKWQENTIRGYGNAIVPQIAFELFRSIMSTGTLHP
ncbi:MAG: hypothetical protein QHC79_25925 [Pseudosphingobacterium sp.]|nr:hypothetical protein [Pseudosphingobacterium sp.]